jgi:flagellar basal-body rod protein FlgF
MDTPGYIVLSRLAAQQRATDVLAANIANADTPGYKANETVFATQLAAQQGIDTARGGRELAFAIDRATYRDFSPGPQRTTGNPLDIAIGGEGFFVLQTPQGDRYTRAGRFTLNAEGGVVDAEGRAVMSDAGPLVIPPNTQHIEIKGDGSVLTETGPVGRLRLVRFEAPQQLQAEGNRNFAAPPESPALPVDQPKLVQGAVEGSNVNSITEITRLTAELREFQFAAQFAEGEDNRLKSAVERILSRKS